MQAYCDKTIDNSIFTKKAHTASTFGTVSLTRKCGGNPFNRGVEGYGLNYDAVVGFGLRSAVSRKRWEVEIALLITGAILCKSRWPWMTLNGQNAYIQSLISTKKYNSLRAQRSAHVSPSNLLVKWQWGKDLAFWSMLGFQCIMDAGVDNPGILARY